MAKQTQQERLQERLKPAPVKSELPPIVPKRGGS